MNPPFTDLRSLYRAADRETVATRADKRAVRTAILAAGIASSTLHAATASGKLISLIPGGAKVFTVGQLVAYAGLGAAVGGALAAVGTATAHRETTLAEATALSVQRQRAPVTRVAPLAPRVPPIEESVQSPAQASPVPSAALTPVSSVQRVKPARLSALPPKQGAQETLPSPAIVPSAVPLMAPQPSLAEESRELGAVQAALGAKDARRALHLLDTQDRQFHGGNLTQERSAARVIALCIAGRISEADLAKSRFVTAYPGSPWLRRIAAACAPNGVPQSRIVF